MSTLAKLQAKLVAAQNCHPNAVPHLIEEALDLLDEIARHEAYQPAQAAADARDALLTESARWEKSDHRLAVWEALRVLGSRMGVMVTREDQYAALATHQQRQDGGEV